MVDSDMDDSRESANNHFQAVSKFVAKDERWLKVYDFDSDLRENNPFNRVLIVTGPLLDADGSVSKDELALGSWGIVSLLDTVNVGFPVRLVKNLMALEDDSFATLAVSDDLLAIGYGMLRTVDGEIGMSEITWYEDTRYMEHQVNILRTFFIAARRQIEDPEGDPNPLLH
jgi:hypothetical protein